MFWKRATWAFALVVVVAIPSVAWWKWPTRLPHPDLCDRDQLYAWVALRDLEQEPLSVQRALVGRFQDLLLGETKHEPIEVAERYRPRVDANRRLLQDRWFYDCVHKFYSLSSDERGPFIDQQLRIASNWQTITKRDAADVASNRASAIGQAVAGWIERASEQDLAPTIGVLTAATLRWLATYDLSGFSPASRERIAAEIMEQIEQAEVAQSFSTSDNVVTQVLPADRELLQRNADLLLRAWFTQQARIYHSHDEAARADYVRNQVDRIRNSPFIPLVFHADGNDNPPNPILLLLRIQQTINRWIREANETDKSMMRVFSAAVYAELIRSGLNPAQKPAPEI